MIIAGVVLTVLGLLVGAEFVIGLGVLASMGGLGLVALGMSGRPLAGRTYWY